LWYLQCLQSMSTRDNSQSMAFIVLRRTRGTQGYYFVESYRDDQGNTRKRTLCYLGRELDGTNTLAKAVAHWEQVAESCRAELRKAKSDRKAILHNRRDAALARIGLLKEQAKLALAREAERKRREQDAELAKHWQAFELLRRQPSVENAKAAKRAFLILAKRHHPDQGGSHQDFLRLKDSYDRARSVWRA
jgi:ABC-type bacteriocin/lantibiotic exporter with double-glycine peptidase domain